MTAAHPRRLALAALWTAAAGVGLFLPERFLPEGWQGWAVLAHLALFGGAAALWTWALPRYRITVLGVLLLVAVGTELGQGAWIVGRSAQWSDFAVNLGGIAAGSLVGWLITRREP